MSHTIPPAELSIRLKTANTLYATAVQYMQNNSQGTLTGGQRSLQNLRQNTVFHPCPRGHPILFLIREYREHRTYCTSLRKLSITYIQKNLLGLAV